MGSPVMQSGGSRDTPGRESPSDRDGSTSRSRSPSKSANNGLDGTPQSPQNNPTISKRKSAANASRRSTTNTSGGLLVVPLELAFNQAMELRAKAILSACMLIGFVDFLANGDLNYLSMEDRRDWTRHILKAVKVRDDVLPFLQLTELLNHSFCCFVVALVFIVVVVVIYSVLCLASPQSIIEVYFALQG